MSVSIAQSAESKTIGSKVAGEDGKDSLNPASVLDAQNKKLRVKGFPRLTFHSSISYSQQDN